MAKKTDEAAAQAAAQAAADAAAQAAAQADVKVAPPTAPRKPAAKPELVTVEVLQPVDHDGARYEAGAELACDAKAAEALIAAGAGKAKA